MFRFTLMTLLVGALLTNCNRPTDAPPDGNKASPTPVTRAEPEDNKRETTPEGIEVTLYPSYGYEKEGGWAIHLRGWVHENRRLTDDVINRVAIHKLKCEGPEVEILKARIEDFKDDSRSGQSVTVQFDDDPDKQPYNFEKSDLNGLVKLDITLSAEKARRLLEAQGSEKRWLTYHVVSGGHRGKGRVRLIEPQGVSVVTDIDDTIKVTSIPTGKDTVLDNTFCKEFVPAPGMSEKYKELGDIPFHYVSGGPWQMYGPLHDFLISERGGFPEGTFHLNYFPKNILSSDTRSLLKQVIAGSLQATYKHKVAEITQLMERFPGRKFILVGDSGEVDPEVYRAIKEKFSGQVQDIWIRDVVGDDTVNHWRLDGMQVIKVEPVVCATKAHHESLSEMVKLPRGERFVRNTSPPCSP